MENEEYESNGMIAEPDTSEPIMQEPPKSGCGCQKNKEQSSRSEGEPKNNSKTLFVVLGVIVVGTFMYYMLKGKKVKIDSE
jgi:hypothetical protein